MCGTGQSKFENEEAYKEHRAKRNSPFMVYTRTKLNTNNVGDIEIQGGKTVSFGKTGRFSKVIKHFFFNRNSQKLIPETNKFITHKIKQI